MKRHQRYLVVSAAAYMRLPGDWQMDALEILSSPQSKRREESFNDYMDRVIRAQNIMDAIRPIEAYYSAMANDKWSGAAGRASQALKRVCGMTINQVKGWNHGY